MAPVKKDDSPPQSPVEEHEDMVEEDVDAEEENSDEEMEEDNDMIANADKVEIVSASSDQTAMTFCFKEEDHTIGNSLRHMINKNPEVDLCGYSIPHPSEAKLHLRIQTTNRTTAIDALKKGLEDLTDMCDHIFKTYEDELAKKDYEVWEEIA
ncbi:DNA-directed RNA polymerase [Phycomyces blakesleeanus]